MDRLSSQDAAFLHIEDGVSHMHIGAVAILEGPPPPWQALADQVMANLPGVPRYRQRVHFVPFGLGRPVWVDDPHFNLAYHVRRTALPGPGGDEELQRLVGRVMSTALDRHKPLWEMWMVEGLRDDRWALLTKVHHAMVDGVSGAELLQTILKEHADESLGADLEAAAGWTPERQPGGAELAARAVAHRLSSPIDGARTLIDSPRQVALRSAATVEGLLKMAGVLQPPPRTSLNGDIGAHRRWVWARAELADVKAIRRALGGTVNDVVLSAVTGGFRELLEARGEHTERVVRTMVPVSVRSSAEQGELNNRVSALFADLPVFIRDPVERLVAVREHLEELKRSHEAVAGDTFFALTGAAPAMLLGMVLRTFSAAQQRMVQTVTTNVPGPQKPLYAAGRRMLECYPYVPLGLNVRVTIAIFSYDGGLYFGITGDYDNASDVHVLGRGVERAMAALIDAAGIARAEATPPPVAILS